MSKTHYCIEGIQYSSDDMFGDSIVAKTDQNEQVLKIKEELNDVAKLSMTQGIELCDLQKDLARSRGDASTAWKQVSGLNDLAHELQQEKTELRTAGKNLSNRVAFLEGEAAERAFTVTYTVDGDLNVVSEIAEELEKENARLANIVEDQENKIFDYKKLASRLESDRYEYMRITSSATNARNSLQAENDELQEENEDLSYKIDDLECEIDDKDHEIEDLIDKLERASEIFKNIEELGNEGDGVVYV